MESLLVTAGRKDSPLHMTDVNYAEVKYSVVKKDGAQAWTEATAKRAGRDATNSTLLARDIWPGVLITVAAYHLFVAVFGQSATLNRLRRREFRRGATGGKHSAN